MLRRGIIIEAYSIINRQESLGSIMTYRFEEEEYRHTYVMEDYYCTNPFCDCNHVTVSFCDQDNENNRITLLLHFNKTSSPLPNQPKWTKVQSEIVKKFAGNLPDELLVLFKQRYLEAKAHGEKDPSSYLLFEPGTYVNYMEMFPRNKEMLDFKYEDDENNKYFVEDAYELDPRNDNRDIKFSFYKLELDSENQASIFTHTYFFNEKEREKEDGKLEAVQLDMLIALNRSIPDLVERLKSRYKQAKKIGEALLKSGPKKIMGVGKVKPNELCPCGSGKKFKKCCALKLN